MVSARLYLLLAACALLGSVRSKQYNGVFLGSLPDPQRRDISGDVYVVDANTLQVIGFNYDGSAPDLHFWVDGSEDLSSEGSAISTARDGSTPLGSYDNERIILNLQNKKVNEIRSVGLWCEAFTKNFGQIEVPRSVSIPRAVYLPGKIEGFAYNVGSGSVAVLNSRLVWVEQFTYTGQAPDAYFFVGRGSQPHPAGVKVPIRGRDTANSISPMLTPFNKVDVYLDLPETHDIYNIDWISVYCVDFSENFGQIFVKKVPLGLVPPYIPPQ